MDIIKELRFYAAKGTYCPDKLMTAAAEEITRLRKQIPAGHKVVPIEPTVEMCGGFFEGMHTCGISPSKNDLSTEDFKEIYRQMIAASPLIEGK